LAAYTLNPPTHYVTVQNTCISGGANSVSVTRKLGANNLILSGSCPSANQVQVTVHDPPMYAGMVLAETLVGAGIQVTGGVARDHTARAALCSSASADDPTWSLLGAYTSTLPEVIARTNKDSMNVYAETLCKRLGFAATGQPGSWSNGTAAVGTFLGQLGVDAKLFHLDDGCGLSKENRIAAHAILTVLMYDHFCKNHQAFFDSLSKAGADGTLKKRFEGTSLRGRVFGKTGFVNSVSALSGYLHAKDDRWYAFSILINGTSGVKPVEEAIVNAIDQVR
jgi:D-alanyl-D-alanine carboxypeptidase/D-alanyl-D-alanine-endopeptidase (penicillin-binding protein 4)